MAKNFGNAGSAKTIKEVAKASAEKAQVIVVKMINNNNLHDYPNNREDVDDTADLENSIKEIGFTDPIEVTAFGQDEGEYMIVSGHRRRSAGVKCGMEAFPCIVKPFESQREVENYVLLANSQRDSAKDPLLFCKRYKMHEEYLKEAGFKGKMRDEIAKRLGISTPQADRYNTMNKIILPVWDMVRDEIVGMSSVLPMASHSEEEQAEIYNIMQEALKKGVTLTRDTVKMIVEKYREGKKTWAEIADLPRDSGLPLNSSINTEPSETREPKEKKPPLTDEEKREKRAKDILKDLEKLNTCLSDLYTFENKEEAEEALRNMASTFTVVVDEMYNISREYDLNEVFDTTLSDMKTKVKEYEE